MKPCVSLWSKSLSGLLVLLGLACGRPLACQAMAKAVPPVAPSRQLAQQSGPAITLDQALALARANEPAFAAAAAAAQAAQLDRSIARAALLPLATYHNEYLFTQANGSHNQAGAIGSQSAPKFVANNTVHEYVSQGVVTETLGLAQFNAVALASAAAAIANAELEISRRGLTATVIGLFYAYSTAQARIEIQQRAAAEAADFVKVTSEREAAREAAHADVIKAQLTLQQRTRDLADAKLARERARLDLAVLLFADPRSPYTVRPSPAALLPTRSELEVAAASNPELASAFATLRARNLEITAARAAYLPELSFAYNYGIDAAQFAVNGPEKVRNLGYSASVTLNIPVWDWLATEHRVKQARIFRDASKVALSAAQRTLLARVEEFSAEAATAHDQLDSLTLSVNSARESLQLTRLSYTAGEANVFEVVDAQNSFTLAELAQQDGTIRLQTALANLQLLTGTI